MKKLLFIPILFFGLGNLTAQNISEDSLVKLIASEACAEIEKEGLEDVNSDNIQMKLGMLFLNSFQLHEEDLKRLYGEDYLNKPEQLRKLGEKIGLNMGLNCRVFQDFMVKNAETIMNVSEKNKTEVKKPISNEKDKTVVMGKISGYTKAEWSYFSIRQSDNTIEKAYWINDFTGSEKMINNTNEYLNKNIIFECKETTVFDGLNQKYKKIKVIMSIIKEEEVFGDNK